MTTAPGAVAPPADEINLALLIIAWPQFAVAVLPGITPRWQARRHNGADPGLYCLITPDLTEIYNELMADTPPATPSPGPGACRSSGP